MEGWRLQLFVTRLRRTCAVFQQLQDMTKKLLYAALALLGALVGCTYPIVKEQHSGEPYLGPITTGTTRQPVQGGCNSYGMYMGSCDLIFTDRKGSHVDGFRLAARLDETAFQFEPFEKWKAPTGQGKGDSKLPYDFYLLTISPAIVLAVPRPTKWIKGCGSVFDQGCIQSMGFGGRAYWYRTQPPIRQGSFWFVEQGRQYFPIESTAITVRIESDGAVVELNSNGETWNFQRTK